MRDSLASYWVLDVKPKGTYMNELVALAIRPSLRDMTSLSLIMCGKGRGIPDLMKVVEEKCDYIDTFTF